MRQCIITAKSEFTQYETLKTYSRQHSINQRLSLVKYMKQTKHLFDQEKIQFDLIFTKNL